MSKKKVLVGMSGGVDSAVSAILLKERGYEVYGATMKLWESGEVQSSCCSISDVSDAKRVCDILDIPHYTLNFKEEFKKAVIDDFICEYSNCRTPNPCIECNKYLKFGAMYQKAKELDIEYIATGHYAKIEYSNEFQRHVLKKSNNKSKDQSYVLYNIPKELLGKVLFPLGDFESKEEIRQIAKENNMRVANKPDSEDICFIPDGNYKKFLEENSNLRPKKGNVINQKGEILGEHEGLYKYTIGQRKGLGISNKVPLFVLGFHKDKNELIVGEEKELYQKEMKLDHINLLLLDEIKEPMRVFVKTRYSSIEVPGTIEFESKDTIKVILEKEHPRITAGQSAVFYREDIVLGGGKII